MAKAAPRGRKPAATAAKAAAKPTAKIAASKPAKAKAAPKNAKAAAKKAPARVSKAKARKVSKGDQLYCEVCGLVVSVDDACGCAACDIICCGTQMQAKK